MDYKVSVDAELLSTEPLLLRERQDEVPVSLWSSDQHITLFLSVSLLKMAYIICTVNSLILKSVISTIT
jgi:hypothetical protein